MFSFFKGGGQGLKQKPVVVDVAFMQNGRLCQRTQEGTEELAGADA